MENFGRTWSCNYMAVTMYYEYKYRGYGVSVTLTHIRSGAMGKPHLMMEATMKAGMMGKKKWKIVKWLDIPTDDDSLSNLAYHIDHSIKAMVEKSQKHQLDLFLGE